MWYFWPNFGAKKTPETISAHDVWEPWKQAPLASRNVIISSQFAARIRRGFFTFGDGCWLPKKRCTLNFRGHGLTGYLFVPSSWQQSVQLLVPTLCRADLGWIFYFGPANFRKIAGEFLSEFSRRILIAIFRPCFSRVSGHPKKFTPKIHVQNCWHSSTTSLSWAQNSVDCKRGRRKGATSKNVKNRQKVSKSFSTLFDNFRAGQKTSKIIKKCQKVFRHFSTIFARHLFSGPFCNPLKKNFYSRRFSAYGGDQSVLAIGRCRSHPGMDSPRAATRWRRQSWRGCSQRLRRYMLGGHFGYFLFFSVRGRGKRRRRPRRWPGGRF